MSHKFIFEGSTNFQMAIKVSETLWGSLMIMDISSSPQVNVWLEDCFRFLNNVIRRIKWILCDYRKEGWPPMNAISPTEQWGQCGHVQWHAVSTSPTWPYGRIGIFNRFPVSEAIITNLRLVIEYYCCFSCGYSANSDIMKNANRVTKMTKPRTQPFENN